VLTEYVELPDVKTDDGLKLPVAPVGSPAALRVTVPLKPFNAAMLPVKVVPDPALIVRVGGAPVTAKSGAPLTINVAVTEWIRLPLVPVMVNE
jgi:hypothetical protein